MNLVVAVSGGVDSIVLLHMLSKKRAQHHIVVAHFDHGIRPESDADARFVEGLAKEYQLPFVFKREELGRSASELTAREHRYAFLKSTAAEYRAKLVTAHHRDDLIETIAINLLRGTGWRGVAVFGDRSISRPLLHRSKADLLDYALEHKLEWVEDETNTSEKYLRNQVRTRTKWMDKSRIDELAKIWSQQTELAARIDSEIKRSQLTSRYDYIMAPHGAAIELLRDKTKAQLTRPQLETVLLAIKTARAGTRIEAGGGISVRFTRQDFIVENTFKLL